MTTLVINGKRETVNVSPDAPLLWVLRDTIGLSGTKYFPGLSLARVGESDVAFDRRVVGWMEAGGPEPLCALTTKELHETGSHELLNWMVLLGAVTPARARVRFFGEMGRIDLAALEWEVQ